MKIKQKFGINIREVPGKKYSLSKSNHGYICGCSDLGWYSTVSGKNYYYYKYSNLLIYNLFFIKVLFNK